MWDLYNIQPSFVLGFHGCDAAVAERVIAGHEPLRPSAKKYDWLGSGVYFWESSPHRALEWARQMAARPSDSPRRIKNPAVVGAVIDLGNCCNLFDSSALDEVKEAWRLLTKLYKEVGLTIPQNTGKTPDRLGRYLDCAVLEFMHVLRREEKAAADYDSVRAAFPEGRKLFSKSGFTARSHIQIAVRKAECIKGYFKPIPV